MALGVVCADEHTLRDLSSELELSVKVSAKTFTLTTHGKLV